MVPPARRSPGRRAVLGLLVVAAAGCSVRAPQARPLPAPAPRTATSAPGPPVSDGPVAGSQDEDVRQALLAGVVALRACTAALADQGGAAPVVAGVGAALAEQARALTTRADAQRPDPARPATTGGTGPTSPADLVAALAAAAAAAAGRVEGPSGPMARLVAAVAAGHAVAAEVLASATSVPAPAGPSGLVGDPGAAGPAAPGTGGRAQVTALVRAREVEAQARYAYGVVAVRLQAAPRSTALARRTVHDQAVGALDAALAGTPGAGPGPRDAYGLPFAVVDDVTAATLAAAVEDGCADAWADVVAAAAPGARRASAAAVTERALTGARWRYQLGRGADLTALPGLSGRG